MPRIHGRWYEIGFGRIMEFRKMNNGLVYVAFSCNTQRHGNSMPLLDRSTHLSQSDAGEET